jgi:hypothetical protein
MAPGLHVEWVGDEAVVLDTDTKELHYLNTPAAIAFALIEEKGYPEALAQLRARFTGETIDEDVEKLVAEMVERGLLVDD